MQFLQQRPDVVLAGSGYRKHGTFAADMFAGRPSFDEMLSFKDWATTLQASMEELLARKACPVKTISIVLDKAGAYVLVTTKVSIQVGDARSAVDTVLKQLPETQRGNVLSSIRAFDELDKMRVDAWVPAWAPRPERPPSDPRKGITLREFLDQEDSEEEPPRPRLLALADATADTGADDQGLWREGLTALATVVLAHAGGPWALTYMRCHRETRRVDLLVRNLTGSASLLDCARIALRMASEGSLPGHTGPRARKTEFLRRCTEALVKANPRAVSDHHSLAPRQAWELGALLGTLGAQPCDRCGIPTERPVAADCMVAPSALEDFRQAHGSVRDKAYCADCAKVARILYCSRCGKDDSMQPNPGQTLYGVKRHRCTRCDTPATALPAKRMCLEAKRGLVALACTGRCHVASRE